MPMLKNTFCHIPGISVGAERELWSGGIHSWDDASEAGRLPLSRGRAARLVQYAEISRRQLAAGNCRHFAGAIPARQHWRMFPEFRDTVAYLDIETTGLSAAQGSVITTIALYDGRRIRHYVRGQNLDQFSADIGDYGLIVTYNGKCFDVPFIEQNLGIRLDQAHIDLRYVLKRLGYGGGLKGCERSLGLDRGELQGVDGFFAVLLWEDYRRSGNIKALETLLAYNIQDVVNLETLLVMAYNLNLRETPFAASHELPLPAAPQLPFQADHKTIGRLLQRYTSGY
ncbi:MAG: ribonuclease H-like domain-containing protein [Tepidisphaeraceae bacterium]